MWLMDRSIKAQQAAGLLASSLRRPYAEIGVEDIMKGLWISQMGVMGGQILPE